VEEAVMGTCRSRSPEGPWRVVSARDEDEDDVVVGVVSIVGAAPSPKSALCPISTS
jgi:hypothetical protein